MTCAPFSLQITGLERDRLKYTAAPVPPPRDLLPPPARGKAAEAAFRARRAGAGAASAAAAAAAVISAVEISVELETVDQVRRCSHGQPQDFVDSPEP